MTMKSNVGIKMDLKKNKLADMGGHEHCNELFASIKCT